MSETARPPGDPGKQAAPMAAPAPAPAPHPTAVPTENLGVTVPGGRYLVPGTTDKFVNSEGKPVDEKGKLIEEK